MTSTYLIRPATSADAQAIWLSTPVDATERAQWIEQRHVVVAEQAGTVVSFAGLDPWKGSCGYRYTAEDSIYIRDGFHGQGIASALLGEIIQAEPGLGYRVIVANIEAGNGASIGLHKKFGFEQVGLMPGVGFKGETALDLAVLQLNVEAQRAG